MATTAAVGKRRGDGGPLRHEFVRARVARQAGRHFVYTLQDKEKIILMMEQGWKNCEIQRATGIPESTLRAIKKKKEDLKQTIALARGFFSDNTFAPLTSTNETPSKQQLIVETEHLLRNWINRRLEERGTISASEIQAQARSIYMTVCSQASIIDPPHFHASVGWLARFKKRSGIVLPSGNTDKPIPVLTIRRATTTYHDIDIKEEPGSPPCDDPLAILPEEESRLRTVNGCRVLPRVIIPALNQSLISLLGTSNSEAHNGTITPELDPSTSDSEATVSATDFFGDDSDFDCDFVGFDDNCMKVEFEESEDTTTEAPPPQPVAISPPPQPAATTPPPQPAAISPPPQLAAVPPSQQPAAISPPPQPVATTPPPQPGGIIPDLSSLLHENSHPKQQHTSTHGHAQSMPPENSHPEHRQRPSTLRHAWPNRARQTPNSVPTLLDSSQSNSQPRTSTPKHTQPSKSRQTPSSVPTLCDSSQSDSQQRTSMARHAQSKKASSKGTRQADTEGSQPCLATRVEQHQAVHPELQGKQREEADVHAELAMVRLENERIRLEILKEVLMQNKIETALKRQEALQSGIDINHL